MANELRAPILITGLAITAKLYLNGALVGSPISCTEVSGSGMYYGTMPAVGAGLYSVVFTDSSGNIHGASEIDWSGTAEVSNSVINTAISAVKTVADAIKIVADKFVFTITGKVDANALTVGDKTGYALSAAANTAIKDAVDASTILAKDATVTARPTLIQIEASTILAKEATLATKSSQTSVNAIPLNPLLTNDIRLNNLANADVATSSRMATFTYTAPDNATITSISNRIPTALVGGKMDSNTTTISAGAITATSIAASALDGKGDWLLSSNYVSPPSIAGLATTAQLTAAQNSIKGASNIDLSQAKTAIDAIPTAPLLAVDYEAPDNGSIMTIKTQVNAINGVTQQVGFDVAGNVNARIKAADTGVIPAPDLSGLATTAQLNATESSIKGAGNKDLTQVFNNTPAVDLTPITSKLPSNGAKIAGEGAIAKNLDQIVATVTPDPNIVAIKTKTDKLTFTVDNKVEAKVTYSASDLQPPCPDGDCY